VNIKNQSSGRTIRVNDFFESITGPIGYKCLSRSPVVAREENELGGSSVRIVKMKLLVT